MPLHLHPRCLRRVQVVEPLVDFVGFQLLDGRAQLRGEALVECHGGFVVARYAISKITLPASPLLIARIASSAPSSGKRCVITGVGSNWPDRRKRVIWCHVSYMRLPTTP